MQNNIINITSTSNETIKYFISLNDKKTISDLLKELKVNENRVVVELNREIIVKEDFSKINLKEDDTVEVISFVGGG